ncbi:helix-turn-helix transcriptional regulator [Thermomicrobium sp. 4228-Ro]|uniref:helix-turn-helix domain-containing protein n=1 Tax=Thermomicrobium sp. 4228-Ro TaxID=2993937 RepID=UPI0022499142|nr:helix-turn-helix transcriptional regulator [Thermomicrobium sp. 4228-Ro]MCX2726346.1 helix-turn-helix transcriptional regulator [Thermomicrobium sp. 4228-Ro]
MSDRLREAIARFLADLRAQRQWTLRELAERSGLSIAYVSELEHGRKLPTLEALAQLAQAYQVSLADFLRSLAARLDGQSSAAHGCSACADLDDEERAELERYRAYLRWKRAHSDGISERG